MTPLTITAHLHSGFVASDPWSPALDGILAYWHVRERLGAEQFSVNQGRDDQMAPVDDLPLEMVRDCDWWWYACSSPIYQAAATVRRYLHRRFDQARAERYLPDGAKKIQTQAGAYKNARLAANHIVTAAVTWHVIGERAEIARLLHQCHHIGAKVGAGFGRVRRWEIASGGDPERARHWRPLPLAYALARGIDGDIMDWGLRPPVRLAANCTACVMPRAE